MLIFAAGLFLLLVAVALISQRPLGEFWATLLMIVGIVLLVIGQQSTEWLTWGRAAVFTFIPAGFAVALWLFQTPRRRDNSFAEECGAD